ncbi:uncharacterized protein LOC107646694 [Arachis ipaensis]|uniref:uncharacterized protein LOC107646694 n=1 Tax=Arachis ipaensis TaxID=130454 RepID=UPI000A2B6EAC|nr:uncharacterized protein LOC107646694 [Arachis ipaensis]
MSTRTADRLWISGVTLTKGLHTREEEEDRVSSQLLLKAISKACKVPTTSILDFSESVVTEECEKQFNEEQELEQLCQIGFKIYPFSSEIPAERKIILPGSFNLLHEGHLKLMEVAMQHLW